MKVIIAGTRDLRDADKWVLQAVRNAFMLHGLAALTEVVSGHGGEVDKAGERYANSHRVNCSVFRADWKQGLKAGPMRNQQMADYADALIAIQLGSSRGTADMIERAEDRRLWTYVLRLPDLPYLHIDKDTQQ